MRSLILLAALPLAAQDVFEQGALVFRQSCAQGYCHGSGGTQGRAPKLIGRTFDAPYVSQVVQKGIPNTGMPGFEQNLEAAKLNAVIAYVIKISGGDTSKLPAIASAAAARMTASETRGRQLFSDALRGIHRCNTCHAVEGIGNGIGPNLAGGAQHDIAAIRNGRPTSVRLAKVGSDQFPALIAGQKGEWVQVYDLTSSPPVLRTLAKQEITFSGESSWNHANAVKNYSDTDLLDIAAYLRWAAAH